ncbi:MAG: SdpI family protein [Anaerolineaceae bacterium]
MSIFDKGFATILACAALLILVAIPLALRKVPRNVVYGYRTRATMADEEIWFEANAHFGRGLIVASICGAFAGYLIYRFRPFAPTVFLPVSVLVLVVPSLFVAVATARYVRSMGRSR